MNPLSQIGTWVTDLIQQMGLFGVGLLVALEKVFPPIPSELILPLTGYLTGQGRMSFAGAIIASTMGSVAGALVLYYIAMWYGEDRVRTFSKRYGHWLQIGDEDLDKADEWFDRRGGAAALFGPLIPVVRSAVSLPAGFRHMAVWKFSLYTAIGSTVWNSLLIGLGWWAGDQWHVVEQYAGYFSYFVIALFVIGIAWFVWKRRASFS
jgi:membrane protein DedA with SNARE-associated domain